MIERGSICWVDFASLRGSQPAKRRPAVVVQADEFNRSRINTVVVVPLTSKLSLAAMPGNVFLATVVTGLEKDSVANVSQVTVTSREFLEYPAAVLPSAELAEVDAGLRLVLGL